MFYEIGFMKSSLAEIVPTGLEWPPEHESAAHFWWLHVVKKKYKYGITLLRVVGIQLCTHDVMNCHVCLHLL